jgi:sensor histidine kinase YesM
MLLPLLSFGLISHHLSYEQLRDRMMRVSQYDVEKIAYYFMMELNEYMNISYFIANNEKIVSAVDSAALKGDVSPLYETALKEISSRDLVKRVKYPFEYFLLSGDELVTRYGHSQRIDYRAALAKINASHDISLLERSAGEEVRLFQDADYTGAGGAGRIYIARKITTPGGNRALIAIVIGKYLMDRLIDNYRQSPDSSIFVFDGEGRCLAEGEGNAVRSDAFDAASVPDMFKSPDGKEHSLMLNGTEMLVHSSAFYFQDMPRDTWRILVLTPTATLLESLEYIRTITVLLALLCVAAAAVLFFLFKRQLFDRIVLLTRAMKKVGEGDLTVRLTPGADEIGVSYQGFNDMTESILNQRERAQKEEAERISLEVAMLRSQITPHFVRNTLNVIRWMAEIIQADGIAQAVVSLIRLFDYNIRDNPGGVTLAEELNNLQEYVSIQKLRFGNKFTYEVRVPGELMGQKTLKLIMQPIVENCIQHGFQSIAHVGHIAISGRREGCFMLIEIEDDGVGIPEAELKALLTPPEGGEPPSKIGVYNVHKRIQYHYGEAFGLMISKGGMGGTLVTLRLPYAEAEE